MCQEINATGTQINCPLPRRLTEVTDRTIRELPICAPDGELAKVQLRDNSSRHTEGLSRAEENLIAAVQSKTPFAPGELPNPYQDAANTFRSRKFGPLRPVELPFAAEERGSVTILFGGLTWKHERLIEGLLAGAGYCCQRLPETDRAAHELGKEFCSSGLCNPVYFTVGNLIRFLEEKEKAGLSREEIVHRFIYFTAACGGPCRFGMYESEFRMALKAAGFDGFRVLSFSQDHGIYASTGHSGLQFSADFGWNALHTFVLGDLLNGVQHRLKPFEIHAGATDKAVARAADAIAEHFQSNPCFELQNVLPAFLLPDRKSRWYRFPNSFGKLWSHLCGNALTTILPSAADELKDIEVDWLRVKPVVKVIGEFWAQMTESDGNFRMLEFLEKEGAEVSIEPISTWLLYLLHQRKARASYQQKMAAYTVPWTSPWRAFAVRTTLSGKRMGFALGARIYLHHFRRLAKLLSLSDQALASQETLASKAAPYYNTFLRGGEGHLEVGKTLYYTQHRACHLVLALKPFGCLPSVQSDAVQASLVEKFPEVSFLPIETSADGEIHAYSRVQMALSEAREKAALEFEQALETTHHSFDEIRAFVADHRELRSPLSSIPRQPGIVSTAANFLLYADQLMSSRFSKDTGPHSQREHEVYSPALDQIHSTQEIES
jgi:predicted nucleotide-binding protein (sugar kinase/HSP70/actin superfamily)